MHMWCVLQALSRAHRIGQTHTVRCVILYSKRTLEERLLKLRQELGTLGAFLSGQGAISGVTEGNTEISHLLSIEVTLILLLLLL
jgi:SNF2 family DNA or RNA helicase